MFPFCFTTNKCYDSDYPWKKATLNATKNEFHPEHDEVFARVFGVSVGRSYTPVDPAPTQGQRLEAVDTPGNYQFMSNLGDRPVLRGHMWAGIDLQHAVCHS